jgi:hypothetical protein
MAHYPEKLRTSYEGVGSIKDFLVCSFFTNGSVHKSQKDVTIRDESIFADYQRYTDYQKRKHFFYFNSIKCSLGISHVVFGGGLGSVVQTSDQNLDLAGFSQHKSM